MTPEATPVLSGLPTILKTPWVLVKVMVCPTVRAVGDEMTLEVLEEVLASAVPAKGYPPASPLLFVDAIAGYARSRATTAKMDAPLIAAIFVDFIFHKTANASRVYSALERTV
jgi:hypothetical protein